MMNGSNKRGALRKLSCLPLLIGLSACGSAEKVQPAVTVADNSCKAFGQITWSPDDTAVTSTQVRRHNRTYAELCPKT